MKCDTTNAILTFVLGALLIVGVIFDLKTINHTREFRSLSNQVAQVQTSFLQAQALANEATAYNQKNPSPELTKLLQAVSKK